MAGAVKAWIEAMRLRTLPVSVAGVLTAVTSAVVYDCFSPWPALLCLLFAVTAQIASNFANEYFDFRNGIDKPGRDGFRRGVAEGDISAGAMARALVLTLALAAALGLSLLVWGGWWLIGAGVLILIGAVAYSGGPWPLSHHGLGDVAVVLFYGLVPVFFTIYLQAASLGVSLGYSSPELPYPLWETALLCGGGIGLMGANVLIVNNYRDADDDRKVGKRTTVVIFGRRAMRNVYLLNWLAGDFLICWPLTSQEKPALLIAGIFAVLQVGLWVRMLRSRGSELNAQLRMTAQLMLLQVIVLLVYVI